MDNLNPFMPTVAFNRDAVSRTVNVERNSGHKWVNKLQYKKLINNIYRTIYQIYISVMFTQRDVNF